ncbi:MAG: hypothetical protein GXP49_07090 [Deltaproteobacteria bacterium]|nr:hypothetical protein [Deltaproteobacteria bacterium]
MKDSSRKWLEGLISVLGDALFDAIAPRLTEHERRISREIERLRRDISALTSRYDGNRAPHSKPKRLEEKRGETAIVTHHAPKESHKKADEVVLGHTHPVSVLHKPAYTGDRPLAPPLKCKQPGCWRNAFKDGYCKQHYQQIVLKPLQDEQEKKRRESTMTVAEYKEVERRLLEKAKELKEKEAKLKEEAIGGAKAKEGIDDVKTSEGSSALSPGAGPQQTEKEIKISKRPRSSTTAKKTAKPRGKVKTPSKKTPKGKAKKKAKPESKMKTPSKSENKMKTSSKKIQKANTNKKAPKKNKKKTPRKTARKQKPEESKKSNTREKI